MGRKKSRPANFEVIDPPLEGYLLRDKYWPPIVVKYKIVGKVKNSYLAVRVGRRDVEPGEYDKKIAKSKVVFEKSVVIEKFKDKVQEQIDKLTDHLSKLREAKEGEPKILE